MKRLLSMLKAQVTRRPGLSWVIVTTMAVLSVILSGARSEVRLPFIILFILTVPGFLVIDLATPRDLVAKIVIGIGGSVSFYLLIVSIALLGSPAWLLPVAGVFLIGLVSVAFRSRSRRRRGRQTAAEEEALDPT